MEEHPRIPVSIEPISKPTPAFKAKEVPGKDYDIDDMVAFLERFVGTVFNLLAEREKLRHLLQTSNLPREHVFFATELMQKWLWYNAIVPVTPENLHAAFGVAFKFAKSSRDDIESDIADWAYCTGVPITILSQLDAQFRNLTSEYMSELQIYFLSRDIEAEWKLFMRNRNEEHVNENIWAHKRCEDLNGM